MGIILPTPTFLYLKLTTRSHINEDISCTDFWICLLLWQVFLTLGNSLFMVWVCLTVSCRASTWRVFKPKKVSFRNSYEKVHVPWVFATYFSFHWYFVTIFFSSLYAIWEKKVWVSAKLSPHSHPEVPLCRATSQKEHDICSFQRKIRLRNSGQICQVLFCWRMILK